LRVNPLQLLLLVIFHTASADPQTNFILFKNISYFVTIADTSSKQFFTDMNLPLSGPYSVIGRTVVIMNDQGTSILACATIQPLQEPKLQATINSGHITGTVNFYQTHGFGARKTMVTSSVTGLNSNHR
jgi:hypothetical protein